MHMHSLAGSVICVPSMYPMTPNSSSNFLINLSASGTGSCEQEHGSSQSRLLMHLASIALQDKVRDS